MTNMSRLFAAIILLFTLQAQAADRNEGPELAGLFKSVGMDGTFVLYAVTARTFTGSNRARAEKRFVPASTFKIPNSLIGLSVGAVKSVDEILPYKGSHKPLIKAWKRDMGLREAIALSNVLPDLSGTCSAYRS